MYREFLQKSLLRICTDFFLEGAFLQVFVLVDGGHCTNEPLFIHKI